MWRPASVPIDAEDAEELWPNWAFSASDTSRWRAVRVNRHGEGEHDRGQAGW